MTTPPNAIGAYADGDTRTARCEGCHKALLDLGDHTPDDLQAAADGHRCTRAGLVAAAWNDTHPIGTPVRYWPGFRVGDGIASKTRTTASVLSGHTAVVWVEGHSACIALTHIELDKETAHA